MVSLSIVIPLYNEAENVPILYNAVVSALAGQKDYELLLVDDGSRDTTSDQAKVLVASDGRVRLVKFRRNYGQTAAMAAGISLARGDIIVTMDGDLQNDPRDIPRLLALINDGYDIAIGWRRKRRDSSGRVFVSKIANAIISSIMGVAVKDSGCSLKAYKAQLIQEIPMYGEMHRFIPALCQLAGARLAQIEVNHRPRHFGVSKYGFSRIYKVSLDIILIRALLSYARRPLAWQFWLTAASIILGLTSIGIALFSPGPNPLIIGSIGVLVIAFALWLVTLALIGHLLAVLDPDIMRYASISAALSSRRLEHKTKAHQHA